MIAITTRSSIKVKFRCGFPFLFETDEEPFLQLNIVFPFLLIADKFQLYLYSRNVIDAPLFYISEAIGKDKYRYYKTLQETRDGDYNEWIRYFLEKCTIQAKKHIEYIKNIDALYGKMEKIINDNINSGKNIEILKALFNHPIITSAQFANVIKISVAQASRLLRELVKLKVLCPDDKKRNTSYYFEELLSYIV